MSRCAVNTEDAFLICAFSHFVHQSLSFIAVHTHLKITFLQSYSQLAWLDVLDNFIVVGFKNEFWAILSSILIHLHVISLHVFWLLF